MATSYLSAFTTQLVDFFTNLSEVIPEEKSIKMALEMVQLGKKANPRMMLELFLKYITEPLSEAINKKDLLMIQSYARLKIETEHSELAPALIIFDKYWGTLSETTQDSIWKYLKVLCVLSEKAQKTN